MADYLCRFRVNSASGAVQERVVQANTQSDAKKVIQAQFAGAKLSWPTAPKKL